MERRPSRLNSCLWVFFVIFQSHISLGCVDAERKALLEIKETYGITGVLSTWVEDETSDCCAWDYVKCSDTTGCVSHLSLRAVFLPALTLLNASSFLPFENLQHLDISHNLFEGCQKHHGVEKLAKLKKLEALNLGANFFTSNILEPLSELTSLKTLFLDNNYIGEKSSPSDISQGLEKLSSFRKLEILNLENNYLEYNVLTPLSEITSLKSLYLRNNYIGQGSSTEISQGVKKLLKLKRLQLLDLYQNSLNDTSILASISELTSLQKLNLGWNQLGLGSPSELSRGFCELKKLLEIDLQYNNLKGDIPPCLLNFTSLRILDLSDNQLSGNILPSLTSNMSSLRWLDLSGNKFTGSIPPSLLFNLTLLQHVSFDDNNLDGTTLITFPLDPNFQLKSLGLSKCNLNTSTTKLKFLHHQTDLKFIDLSHNNIHGHFPLWLVANNTQLKILVIKNNSLSGDIQFPLHCCTNIEWIDISKNHIEGHIQPNLGRVLNGANYLNLSQNHLQGSIPTSLGNMQDLVNLDLSNNNFTGEIPESLALLQTLASLILSNNRLQGHISPIFLNHIMILRLDNNHFTGFGATTITTNNNNWPLTTLDLSKNNISGRIPSWIGNLSLITSLSMGDNSFHGLIPLELCNLASLNLLDLSQNKLSGSIPSCLNLTFLIYMHLQGNKLTGILPPAILRSPYLFTLDLNHNSFSGNIPRWLGLLKNLVILLLKGNRLSGSVPYELCKLKKIWIMDLSHNGFSGSLPPCFNDMAFGKSRGIEHDIGDQTVMRIFNDTWITSILGEKWYKPFTPGSYLSQDEVEFMTKSLSSLYKGHILEYMSGMDLSSNGFTGEIPKEFGALTAIRSLNLSYNQFIGSIPKTLSKLKQLESMDLSHNNLSGSIPSELTGINTLAIFFVAYNNLSGQLPDMKAQFSTFTETSYEGNPFLCGLPLQIKCRDTTSTTGSETTTALGLSEKFGVDLISFLASSSTAYIMSLLALVIVLYVNPYWRRMWFDYVDACLNFVFPFWSEAIYRVSNPFT